MGDRPAKPALTFYLTVIVAMAILNVLLFLYAKALIVSAIALIGGCFEVAAAYVALSGERGDARYPRFVFHLIVVGFMCLVLSILWQQYLQPVATG